MVTAIQVAGLTVTAALLAKLLRPYAAEQAMLLTLLTGIGITAAAVLTLSPVLQRVDSLLLSAGLSANQTVCVSKAIGICCITQLSADICKDAGENTLCTAVMMTGKAALLLLILPQIDPLLTLIREVLSCVTVTG